MKSVHRSRSHELGGKGAVGSDLGTLVSLPGFQCGCSDAHHDGHDGEALGEDASAHEQLGLPGLPLFKCPEAVDQRACGAQAT